MLASEPTLEKAWAIACPILVGFEVVKDPREQNGKHLEGWEGLGFDRLE